MLDVISGYIYYNICESSYDIYAESSNYGTYSSFCDNFTIMLENNDMRDIRFYHRLSTIISYICEIYGLSYTEGMAYVHDYFTKGLYKNYEKTLRLMRLLYKV